MQHEYKYHFLSWNSEVSERHYRMYVVKYNIYEFDLLHFILKVKDYTEVFFPQPNFQTQLTYKTNGCKLYNLSMNSCNHHFSFTHDFVVDGEQ